MLKFRAAIAAMAILLTGVSLPVGGATVTVFAAASLKEAMDAQVKQFASATGSGVTVAYGASNALAKQIEAGAPAALFISADVEWMDFLEQRHLLVPNSRSNLLGNELVLIAPKSSSVSLKIAPGFPLAATLGPEKLAMADPDAVPAGKYGRRALEALGVWSSVRDLVVRTPDVRAALAFVARGEAAFGIVYGTDAMAEKAVRIVDAFPESTHPPIVYPVALVAPLASLDAKALLDFLRSRAARSTWEKYGFIPL